MNVIHMNGRSQAHLLFAAATAAVFGASHLLAQGPLPPPPVPAGNPITAAKTNLGKVLFWDEQMSSTGTVACATCHTPEAGGADLRTAGSRAPGPDGLFNTPDDTFGSPGVIANLADGTYVREDPFALRAQVTGRRAPSVLMAAYPPFQFWDGRRGSTLLDPHTNQVVLPNTASLENQVLEPPLSPVEMNHAGADWTGVEARLAASRPLALASNIPAALDTWIGQRSYGDLFREAFGTPDVTAVRVAMAIATYERTLIPNQAPIDAFLAGNQAALTPQEQRGLQIFNGPGRCVTCHGGPTFDRAGPGGPFRNIGVRPPQEDRGRFNVTNNPQDDAAFKIPSLRNVAQRAPYFHNGGKATLEDVVAFYQRGGDFRGAPNIAIQPFQIAPQDRDALVAFLRNALTDPRPAQAIAPYDHPTLYSRSGRAPQPYGPASPGGNGRPPRLVAVEPPVLGNANFTVALDDCARGAGALLLVDAAPGSQSVFGLPVNLGLTGALVTVPLGQLATQGPVGWTSWAFALPTDPALHGGSAYCQAFASDPVVPLGLVATAGLRVTFFAPR